MSSKAERARIIRSGSPLRWHSLNQVALKREGEGRNRIFDDNSKAARAHERRREKEEFLLFWYKRHSDFDLSPKERFKQALGRMMDGGETCEDVIYVLGEYYGDFEEFGYKVDRFIFPAKTV